MDYSNNFIANQLLLATGAVCEGEPATLKKGVEVFKDFLENEIGIYNFSLAEGSGLSRKNSFSPVQMQKLLDAFFFYRGLLPSEDGVFRKTGTLNGIFNLMGYYENKAGEYRQFVIFLSQWENNRDKIIKILKENL